MEEGDETGSFIDIEVSETRGRSKNRDDDLVGVTCVVQYTVYFNVHS